MSQAGSMAPRDIDTNSVPIGVMLVSPFQEDHDTLKQMLCMEAWTLFRAYDLFSAISQLNSTATIPLILCERDLSPGSWKEMLMYIQRNHEASVLIVVSRFADEQLWGEALNMGAYDVLAKPFDKTELNRSLRLASSHWQAEFKIEPKAFSIAAGVNLFGG